LSKNRIWWQAFIKAVCCLRGERTYTTATISSSSYGSTAQFGPWLPLMGFHNNKLFTDQASIFMTFGDRVSQLYPQALGTHFSRLLRHAWVTWDYSLIPATTWDVMSL
jgi:hypothetical protein